MQPVIYLFFKDTCREAFTLYGEVFGAAPEIMTVGDLPPGAAPPGLPAEAVMHASVRIGSGLLNGSDDPSGATPAMAGCNIAVQLPNDDETRRVYAALSAGGEIRQPLAPEFWTSLHAAFTDRFGTRWMVMTEIREP